MTCARALAMLAVLVVGGEHPGDQWVDRTTGQPIGRSNPCVSLGASIGYDPHAHREAVKAVNDAFLTSTFSLGP